MNWAEAFSSFANAALPVIAAIGGSVATYWFSEMKARREAREQSARAQSDGDLALLRARYKIYTEFIQSLDDLRIALASTGTDAARAIEVRSAAKSIESSLLSLELLASKKVFEPARSIRRFAFDWGDIALKNGASLGLPKYQLDDERFALIEIMRADLDEENRKLGRQPLNTLDLEIA